MTETARTLRLEIVSAHGQVYSGDVRMVSVQAVNGELGILPRHAPLITFLKPGEARVTTASGDTEYIYVSGGFMEIQPFQVTVLADTALRGEQIDEEAAQAAKRAAEQAMQDAVLFSDRDQAYVELLKALAQLQTLADARKKRKA